MKDDNYCHHEHEEEAKKGGDKGQTCKALECIQGWGVDKNWSRGHGHFS